MSLFDFGSKIHVQCTNDVRGIITVWFLLLSGFLLLESTKLLLQCYYYHVILYRIAICAFYGFSFGIVVFTFWMNYYLIFVIFWLITIANHQITSVLYLYCTAKGLFLRFGFWDRCFSCLDEQCTFAKEKKNLTVWILRILLLLFRWTTWRILLLVYKRRKISESY